MSARSVLVKIREAVFGKPLTREQADIHVQNQRMVGRDGVQRSSSPVNQINMY